MDTRWIIFALVLVTNALLALFLAVLLRRKHAAAGRNSMMWMLVMLAVWAFSYAMITISPSMDVKILWLKLENIGILPDAIYDSGMVRNGTFVVMEHSRESIVGLDEKKYEIIRKPFGQTIVLILKALVL